MLKVGGGMYYLLIGAHPLLAHSLDSFSVSEVDPIAIMSQNKEAIKNFFLFLCFELHKELTR